MKGYESSKEAHETLKGSAESKKNDFDNVHSFKFVIKYGTISQPDWKVVGMIHARNRSEAYEILKERTFKRLYDPLNMNRTVIEYGYLKEY